jgi:hypothetical protein
MPADVWVVVIPGGKLTTDKGIGWISTDFFFAALLVNRRRHIFGGAFLERLQVNSRGQTIWLWKKAIFGVCGELWCFVVLLGLFWVCIGIYQVLRSRFLCAKRGQIVVNCVAGRGHKDGG